MYENNKDSIYFFEFLILHYLNFISDHMGFIIASKQRQVEKAQINCY